MNFMRLIFALSLASVAFSHCVPSLHFFNVTTGIDFLSVNASGEVPISSLSSPFDVRAEFCNENIHSAAFRFLSVAELSTNFEIGDRVDNTEPFTSGPVFSGKVAKIQERLIAGDTQVLAVAGFDNFKATGDTVDVFAVLFALPKIENPTPRIAGFFTPPPKVAYK